MRSVGVSKRLGGKETTWGSLREVLGPRGKASLERPLELREEKRVARSREGPGGGGLAGDSEL